MTARRSTTRLVAAACVLALAAAACGSDGEAGGAPVEGDLVAFVASTPHRMAAEPVRMRAEVEVDGDVLGSVEAAIDPTTGAASFEMDFAGAGSWLPDADLDGFGFEMRAVDGVVYLNTTGFVGEFLTAFVGLFADVPDDVEWLRFDTPAAVSEQFGGADPNELFDVVEVLRGAGTVEEIGREEVRGVATTHYLVEVDLRDALDDVAEAERAAVEQAFDRLGVGTVPVEAWVDDEGLVRRFRVAYDASDFGEFDDESESTTATLTIEFFDFGEALDIAVPPADRTANLDDLGGGLLDGLFEDLLDEIPGVGD